MIQTVLVYTGKLTGTAFYMDLEAFVEDEYVTLFSIISANDFYNEE